MRYRLLLGELLPVCGTVGLLGLWLFQQVGIDQRAAKLRKIAAARSIYQTYQSNNAVFNAIGEVATKDTAKDRLRTFQTYNYELGLAAIEDALPAEERRGIPLARSAYDGTPIDDKVALTQRRLELLQSRLADYEKSVRDAADRDRRMYFVLYLIISAVSLAGALLKVMDKLAASKSVAQGKNGA
jgi:hypothetical protein